jgi:hypothetical protein
MADARAFLAGELGRLGACRTILSTNVELRLDGLPMSNRAMPKDPGAAVYFDFSGKPVALACDKWLRVEDNVYAMGKHIEALRGQQRWGVGRIEQAFRGYLAIPERTGGSAWWDVLGVAVNASPDQAREAFLAKARLTHPDAGGSTEAMVVLNAAWDEARRQLGII